MPEKLYTISSDAVKQATGTTWERWVMLLDHLGATTMAHREIARMLHDRKLIKNAWWCQMVTNGCEKARGRRVLGQTADGGFQIGVTKTLPMSPRAAWEMITSPRGFKRWLGDAPCLKFMQGEEYKTRSGLIGEFRTVRPGQRLRLTYQPRGAKAATTLQVTVIPRQTTHGTCVGFYHEKFASAQQREQMRRHWQQVLRQFNALTLADDGTSHRRRGAGAK